MTDNILQTEENEFLNTSLYANIVQFFVVNKLSVLYINVNVLKQIAFFH